MVNRDYLRYIVQRGNQFNIEIKNNIEFSFNEIIRLLLIDYIKDTMDNYDYRYCPEYIKNHPIEPEDNVEGLIFENEMFLILSESDEILISEDSLIELFDHIGGENSDDYLSLENDYQRFIFDKANIEKVLQHLIKDITCLQ